MKFNYKIKKIISITLYLLREFSWIVDEIISKEKREAANKREKRCKFVALIFFYFF